MNGAKGRQPTRGRHHEDKKKSIKLLVISRDESLGSFSHLTSVEINERTLDRVRKIHGRKSCRWFWFYHTLHGGAITGLWATITTNCRSIFHWWPYRRRKNIHQIYVYEIKSSIPCFLSPIQHAFSFLCASRVRCKIITSKCKCDCWRSGAVTVRNQQQWIQSSNQNKRNRRRRREKQKAFRV